MLEGFRPCPFCGTNDIHIIGRENQKEIFENGVRENGDYCVGLACECGAELWQFHETDYDVAIEHLKAKWNARKRGKKDEEKRV